MSKYDWDEAFRATDGYCWCLGYDLLHCIKEPTGEVVIRSYKPFIAKNLIEEIECQVYRIETNQFEDWQSSCPVKDVYIAIADDKHYEGGTVVYNDKNSFQALCDWKNKQRGA